MKNLIALLSVSLWLSFPLMADTQCFLMTENSKVIQQKGNCDARQAPCSTFKIVLSLMGYNEGLLIDARRPEWPFKEGYVDWLDSWKRPHNPTTWIKNSCLWYSQVLTQKLGINKLKDYVAKFNYGNQDLAGDKGKNNGLTHAWLSSSLQISPKEQVAFLEKLVEYKLPVSSRAHEMTKNILFVEGLEDGWSLYGKSGSGYLLHHDGTRDKNHPVAWFVGWIEKGKRNVVFAYYIGGDTKRNVYARNPAKASAIAHLITWIRGSEGK